jgi:thiamine-monophosphate kinase
MSPGEFDYIDWVRKRISPTPGVLIGPGDDCAALVPPTGPLLVTTDVLTEGVDFLLAEHGGRAAGRKAMAANLSDMAAMAGRPTAAVVGVVLPRSGAGGWTTRQIAEDVFWGLEETARAHGVPLVGGDTNTWDGGLVVAVTVLGEATRRGPVRRSGASPGDWIVVTGPCGGSILGRHLDPKPRVREALALHEAVPLHALIDVSDGLAADLEHICRESGCGAVLVAADIPISPDAHELARRTGQRPLDHALGDGEDFELIFTVAPADGRRLLREQPVAGVTLVRIGECVESGFWLEEDGRRRPLEPTGWVHKLE